MKNSRRLGCARAAFLALALTSAAPIAAHAEAAAQQAQSHGVPVQEVVSPNGIRAWLVSDDTVPMIVLNAYWKGGSALEEPRMTGLTGVMTDMLSEGAGDLDSNAFKVRLEELNMQLGFSSSWDGVSMGLVTLTQNRDAAFEMARVALMSPRFDAPPLERIKRQLAVSIRQRETNPSYIANLALDQALIPDHPYARRATLASVNAINRAALVNWRAQLLKRARLQITVVGDIDAATLGPLLDRTFGALPSGEAALAVPQAAQRPPTPLIVRPLPQPQSLILFSAPGIDDDDPDWIPLAVANYILGGGGFSSRLMDEVREERGLVYGISTTNSVRDGAAFIRGAAQTRNESVGEAIETTRAEIGRLYRDGPAQAEVDDAIRYLTGSFALDLDSNVKIASTLFSYQAAGRPIDYINRRNDLIRAVTRDDVVRVMRRLYDPAKFTFVAVGQPAGLDGQPPPPAQTAQ
ncbi:MAG: pitrilysin family protein [Caulobacterales bacterium]